MHIDQSVSLVESCLTPAAPRVSWAAIFAGALVAVGVWLLFHLLGMSIGMIAVDPNEPIPLRGVGLGVGVWSLIAPVLALFVGGFAAGQLTGPVSRITGALHGAVMWSLATVASLALVWTMVAALLGGACLAGAQVPTTPGAIEQGYGQHGALEAVEDSGKAMLGLFFSLLVGLGAAVGGSVLGVRGEQKRLDREMRGQTMQSLGTPPV